MPVIRPAALHPETGTRYPPPFDSGMGRATWLPLSDAGGLTQFGAALETLPPGAVSSHRHWHEAEDEFLYMLSGYLVLVENDGEHPLGPGDAAAWKAGDPNAHHLVNRSAEPATYLIVGTRAAHDRCHYPDLDLLYTRDAGGRRFTARDGSPLP